MSSRVEVLRLYRAVLRAAARFPSKKRASIIEDIKLEFREGAVVTDAALVQRRLAVAHDGLVRLRQYSGLERAATDWDVSLAGASTSKEP
jgi:hypothetical protein